MNLKSLELFVHVADLGSFTSAAKEMGMTQPAASLQIQSLEEHYGVQVVDRGGRGISLTESGRIVYQHARQILSAEQECQLQIDRLNQLLRGRLALGASIGPGEHILPDLLGRFKAEHPQIEVSLRILPTAAIVQSVQRRELEVGIVGAPPADKELCVEAFIKDDLILIAPPDHPWAGRPSVTFEEWVTELLILQQEGAGVRLVLEAGLDKLGLTMSDLNVFMEVGPQESIKTAVRQGYGVAFISRYAVQQELALGTLVRVAVADLPPFREQFFLVRLRSRKLSFLTETFLELARQRISGSP